MQTSVTSCMKVLGAIVDYTEFQAYFFERPEMLSLLLGERHAFAYLVEMRLHHQPQFRQVCRIPLAMKQDAAELLLK